MNSELAFVFPGAISSDLDVSIDQKTPEHEVASRGPLAEEAGISRIEDCPDETLLEDLLTGNKEVLGVLFRRYARMVRAVAYRILKSEAEADDLVQEVFLFVYRKGKLFDSRRGSARSWIVQVTYSHAIDRRRHLATRHFYTSLELSETTTRAAGSRSGSGFYEESIEGVLGKERMQKIAESLSADQRQVLELYFYEGYALEEIAQKMMQTVGNIRNHYYRGLERLRRGAFEAKLKMK